MRRASTGADAQGLAQNVILLAHGVQPSRPRGRKAQLSLEGVAPREKIDLTWHDLRHEAASRWLEKKMDLREIQYLLGHSSLTTTERYLQVRPGRISESFAQMWANQTEVRVVPRGPRTSPKPE